MMVMFQPVKYQLRGFFMQVQWNACILRSFVLSEKWKLKMQNRLVFFFFKNEK